MLTAYVKLTVTDTSFGISKKSENDVSLFSAALLLV